MKSINNFKNQERSFTIIELLVVIAVIGLLAAIVIVAISGVRERAQLARTASWAATNHRMLSADIVLSLDFEECRNVTTTSSFRDASGFNNNATCDLPGGRCPTCVEGVPGVTGRALDFSTDDITIIPSSRSLLNAFGPTTNFTIEAWTFAKSWGGSSLIINNSTGASMSLVTNGLVGDNNWCFGCVMGN